MVLPLTYYSNVIGTLYEELTCLTNLANFQKHRNTYQWVFLYCGFIIKSHICVPCCTATARFYRLGLTCAGCSYGEYLRWFYL